MVEQAEFNPTPIAFGKGVINATTSDFVRGFQAGQDDYVKATAHHHEPYMDKYITELFFENLEDMTLSSLFSIGYAIGWLDALAMKGNQV